MAKSETIKNEDIWQKDKLGIKQHVTSFANILKQEKYVEKGTSKATMLRFSMKPCLGANI